MRRVRLAAPLIAVLALAASAGPAAAVPIPQGPTADVEAFTGAPAEPHPVSAPDPPRHPHMAPNGLSNLHDDAYQTDTYQWFGPLGKGIKSSSEQHNGECASITFDTKGRIVSVCVGVSGPNLELIDPASLQTLARFSLPPRNLSGLNFFQSFSGGGYFYLDDRDRAIVPTTSRHLYVIRETDAPGFELERDYDLTDAVPDGDAIISALPDWDGNYWFVSKDGVVGWVEPVSGKVWSRDLKEPIGNSFAVDEEGGVYVVSDAALYRFERGADGPATVWRETYENIGVVKPGQTEKGSGTTPTIMGRDLVSITDNADPMNVVVYKRARTVEGERRVCRQPVFEQGASNTDQSLIATPTSMVVENNYGYTGPTVTENGRTTAPGLARVDMAESGRGCRLAWNSKERAPSVVPKLSLAAGLVYTYTKDPREDGADPWYLTALDFRTGKTVYKALAGEGLGFNNNYAPVTLARDGTAFIGVLGGLTALRDATPPKAGAGGTSTAPARGPARMHIRQVCRRHRRGVRVRAYGGRSLWRIDVYVGGRWVGRDRRRPLALTVHRRRGRLRVRGTFRDGRRFTVRTRLRRCR